jgi:hypothetical protein
MRAIADLGFVWLDYLPRLRWECGEKIKYNFFTLGASYRLIVSLDAYAESAAIEMAMEPHGTCYEGGHDRVSAGAETEINTSKRRRRKRRRPPRLIGALRRPFNGEIADRTVPDPYPTTGGKIVATTSPRDDPLGRLYARRQIDEAQYRTGLILLDSRWRYRRNTSVNIGYRWDPWRGITLKGTGRGSL